MKLTINFAGICTHFRHGVAAGVPHRVVLPDATNFVTGLLNVEKAPAPDQGQVLYYLMPHYAQLELLGGPEIHVPSLTGTGGPAVRNGDILAPIRLQVVNAVDQKLEYAGEELTRSLTEFVPDYTFSTDVVLNGRAACYFDVYGGRVSSYTVSGGASQTRVEMRTDGIPELLVTPLASSGGPVRSHRLQLLSDTRIDEVTLWVKNLELADAGQLDEQKGAFDYLFHYLTARGGIPQTIRKVTPGMQPDNLVCATPVEIAGTLAGMAAALGAAALGGGKRALVPAFETTPACGDSRYP
ncbi:MAG TPA: hypothetical protein VGF28_04205 [Thermoanaerobaculia bacterium]|jgi:hypothetical protein